jgi:hypothetical protein
MDIQNFSNMKNRIASNLTADYQKKFLLHLDALVEMSGTLIEGTSMDDMQGGQDMGNRNGRVFAQDAFAMATDHPKLIEDEDSSLKDFEADVTRLTFLLLVQDQLAILQKTVNQAWILTGKDLMEQAGRVLSELRKRKNNPKFAVLYERLNRIYTDRQKRIEETKALKATWTETKSQV